MNRRVVPVVALVVVLVLAGCGQQNSYAAVEGALRDWLAAASEGEQVACDLVSTEYRRELAREASTTASEATCAKRIAEMADSGDSPVLPPADSEMQVPVWDPSGEALVEVSDATSGRVSKFWMRYEDGVWLVAGREA